MSKKAAGRETKYNAKKKAVVNNSVDCNVTFWSVGVEIRHPECLKRKRLQELKMY
jgi:hypothetical protein